MKDIFNVATIRELYYWAKQQKHAAKLEAIEDAKVYEEEYSLAQENAYRQVVGQMETLFPWLKP